MNEKKIIYQNAGFMHPIGFGRKSALLIVDAQRAVTDSSSPLGTDFEYLFRG
jgi:hypothetical protein